MVKVTPKYRGEITAAVSQGTPEPRVSDMRSSLAFLSNSLEGEFHSETSCIDGVMFPADSFAVCTAASLNSS